MQNRPVVGRDITVQRPAGPLAAALWPKVFTTDGAGVAVIPTLEAAKHTVQVVGDPASATILEPPTDPAAAPVEALLVIRN